MTDYIKGEEKKHFSTIIAALIIIAVAIGSFIYALVTNDEEDNLEEILIENDGGTVKLSPGPGLATPTSEPNIPQPTSPPA